MSSFFSSDGSFSLQFAIIFLVIFAILAVGVFALRGLTGRGRAYAPKAGARGRQPRLGIVDIYELDRQRQLILLRRDNVEHLLLVGGPNDVVIERNITRGLGARLSGEDSAEAEPQPQAAQTPDFGQPPPAPYLEPQREPSFEMPVVVPPPVPGSDAPPPQIGRPLEVSARPDYTPPPLIPAPAPVAAPPRRESALTRVIRRAPPSLTNLVPGAGAERVRLPEAPRPTAPEPVPETSVPAPVPPSGTGRAIDAAILSDMARQLEEALRRPSAAVRPAPSLSATPEPEPVATTAPPAEPEPEPAAPEPAAVFVPAYEPEPEPEAAVAPASEPEIDPVAAAMAATSERTEPEPALPPVEATPETVTPETVASEPGRQQPEISHSEVADAAPAPALPDAPAPQNEPSAPEPAPPVFVEPAPEPPPASKPAASPNPFSVEEIEAEFARLLGRPLDRKN